MIWEIEDWKRSFHDADVRTDIAAEGEEEGEKMDVKGSGDSWRGMSFLGSW